MSIVVFKAKLPPKSMWKRSSFLTGLRFINYPNSVGFDSATMLISMCVPNMYVIGREGKTSFVVPHYLELPVRLAIRHAPEAFHPFGFCSYNGIATFATWTGTAGWEFIQTTLPPSISRLRIARPGKVSPLVASAEDLLLTYNKPKPYFNETLRDWS